MKVVDEDPLHGVLCRKERQQEPTRRKLEGSEDKMCRSRCGRSGLAQGRPATPLGHHPLEVGRVRFQDAKGAPKTP